MSFSDDIDSNKVDVSLFIVSCMLLLVIFIYHFAPMNVEFHDNNYEHLANDHCNHLVETNQLHHEQYIRCFHDTLDSLRNERSD